MFTQYLNLLKVSQFYKLIITLINNIRILLDRLFPNSLSKYLYFP